MTSPIVKQLRLIRRCQGVSQEALANLAGYNRTSVDKWERGLNQPSIQAVINAAQALGYELVLRPKI